MSKTVLASVEGFTPIIDSVADEVGLVTAAVFGRVWRFCQMDKGICDASIATLADYLHLSTRTIIRHLDRLVGFEYLKDLTPDLRNVPHTYADTGKAGIEINVTAGMTKSHSGYDKKSQRGMTKSHLKKEVKKEKEIDLEIQTAVSFKTRDIQKAYEDCVPYAIDWAKGESSAAKWLAENGATPAEIKDCYTAVKSDPWWADKPLSLVSLKKKFGEWKYRGSRSSKIIKLDVINA